MMSSDLTSFSNRTVIHNCGQRVVNVALSVGPICFVAQAAVEDQGRGPRPAPWNVL